MPKQKVLYVCSACGFESPGWLGRCTSCGNYNTMEEVPLRLAEALREAEDKVVAPVKAIPLDDVNMEDTPRFSAGSGEIDRVLGGGVVPGSLVLVGGDPGIGKSTLLLQAAAFIGKGATVLYVTGEESPAQVRIRAERVGAKGKSILLFPNPECEHIEKAIKKHRPALAVVDSVQTLYNPDLPGMPGSVTQLREGAMRMMRLAKATGCAIFLIGHVTKEGGVAGPRVLEHVVDAVLYLEGDHALRYRILRAVKNRFGSTNEIGLFEMKDSGMIPVENPSEMLISPRAQQQPGSVLCACVEGTRAMLVEVQALVSPTVYGTPRRMGAGFDVPRLGMLLAVLEKRVGLPIGGADAYLNVAGGLKLTEPAADLGVVMALASSLKGVAFGAGRAVFGEVGLTGEVRPVSQAAARVGECAKLGIKKLVLPFDNLHDVVLPEGMECHGVKTVREALACIPTQTRI